jgi:hypothetical protein
MIEYTILKFILIRQMMKFFIVRRFSISANSSKRGSDVCLGQDWKSLVLWYVVAVGAPGNIILIWMLNMRFFTHIILGVIVAFFLGVVIFLIIAMDRPMRGEVSVQPAAYQLVYEVLMQWDEGS